MASQSRCLTWASEEFEPVKEVPTATGDKIVKRSGGEPVGANLDCQVLSSCTGDRFLDHRIMTRFRAINQATVGERTFTSKLCLPRLL